MVLMKSYVLALCCLAVGAPCIAAPKQPNIVVLVADDWGVQRCRRFRQ